MIFATMVTIVVLGSTGLAVGSPGNDRVDVPPPGANNWGCRSAAHPRPVILVHGTTANQNQNWHTLSPALTAAGYCVYTVTMGALPGLPGIGGLDRLSVSTKQLAAFVEKVLRRTGAPKVDFVGHSQGVTLQLRYLRDYGGAAKAGRVIGLAGLVSGPTRAGGLDKIPPDPSNYRFANYPTVTYANIASRTDGVVTPPSISFMKPAPNVTNILVQAVCPQLRVGHDGMSKNPAVRQIILNQLDPSHRNRVPCAGR